jgi:hypothetical protein
MGSKRLTTTDSMLHCNAELHKQGMSADAGICSRRNPWHASPDKRGLAGILTYMDKHFD